MSKTDSKAADAKKKILIVDDSELNRSLLSDMLSDDFDIVEAENGEQAVFILQERELDISLMLLDIVMPDMDGFEVLAIMNRNGWIKTIPVIMISAETSTAYIDRAYNLGAVEYISRPFDERTVKHRVMSNFMLAHKQKELAGILSTQVYERERDNRLMVEILSHIVEFRNGESGLHILHVNIFTDMILKHLLTLTDKYKLTQSDINTIVNASALHDIGKMSVPESVLNKPGRLTKEEFEVMKGHSAAGEKMLKDIPYRSNEKLIRIGCEICRWHHERYDGSGYPDGIKGDDIPISAQVVALADVYDALTSKRVYKDSFSHEKAVEMIMNGECGAFNPIILQCLDELKDRLKKELKEMSYGRSSMDRQLGESVEQALKKSGSDVSERTVRLLEHERMKFNFFAGLSREVMFEYMTSPEMISLSEWGADYLGLPQKIMDPATSEFGTRVFSKVDFNRLMMRIHAATPENSIVEEKFLLNIKGERKWNKVIVKTLWNDDEGSAFDGAIGKLVDVNDETEEMQQLEKIADHDALTGLLNHAAAKRIITKLLASAGDRKYALLFFDLDNLKKANDVYGHLFGNKLIKTVADRMKKNTRASDVCARMGGDEFIIFMEYKQGLEQQIKRIFDCLTKPLDDFEVSVSMGVACAEHYCGDYDSLFHMADQAAYAVKYGGKNAYKFYAPVDDEKLKTEGDKPQE